MISVVERIEGSLEDEQESAGGEITSNGRGLFPLLQAPLPCFLKRRGGGPIGDLNQLYISLPRSALRIDQVRDPERDGSETKEKKVGRRSARDLHTIPGIHPSTRPLTGSIWRSRCRNGVTPLLGAPDFLLEPFNLVPVDAYTRPVRTLSQREHLRPSLTHADEDHPEQKP